MFEPVPPVPRAGGVGGDAGARDLLVAAVGDGCGVVAAGVRGFARVPGAAAGGRGRGPGAGRRPNGLR